MSPEEKNTRENIIKDHKNNYFVEAGAGAGKTRMVVDRIINQLTKGGYRPSEIVAITFTNAAAAELQGRIINGLRETANSEVLSEIDQMFVGTIHSFCFRLLKERAFGAKLRPDLKLLEETDDKRVQEQFMSDWYLKNDSQLVKDLEPFDYKGPVLLGEYFGLIANLPEDVIVEYDQDILKTFNETMLKNEMEAAVKALSRILSDPTNMLLVTDSNKKICTEFAEYEKNNEYENALNLVSSQSKIKKLFTSANNYQSTVSSITSSIWSAVDTVIQKKNNFRAATMMKIALQARGDYLDSRSTEYISNDGLLQAARDLICREDNKEDRAWFAGRYRCIYVDEFQDTDHVQTEMILKLGADINDDSKLRDGALFVVGDPKQSIYRFRGAEPEIYYEVMEFFKGQENCKVEVLATNFRSNEKIIGWVNDNYKVRINNYTDMEVCDRQKELSEELEKVDEAIKQRILRGVYSYNNPVVPAAPKKRGKADEAYRNEAEIICKIIKTLVEKDYYIGDAAAKNKYRKIVYKDFLVLSPGLKNMDEYMDAFMENNIPVEVYGSINITEDEVCDSLFRMYSYLSSGMTDRTYKQRAVEVLIRQGVEKNEERDKLLDELRNRFAGENPFSLFLKMLQNPRVFLPCKDDDVEQHRDVYSTSLKRLHQIFENIITSVPCSRQSVLEAISAGMSAKLEREMRRNADQDVIRFMNEHKAKGLEGKIVILATRKKQDIKQEAFFYRDSKKRNHFYCGTTYGPNCYASDSPEAKADREASAKEQTRLEYVTATRAEEVLIFLDPLEKNAQFCYDGDDYGRAAYKFENDKVKSIRETVSELNNNNSSGNGEANV